VYTNDIHGLLCATTLGISLEFYIYWHNVAWMMDTSKNIYHVIWINGNCHLPLITRMCFSLHLSLHVYAMIVIEITCCVP